MFSKQVQYSVCLRSVLSKPRWFCKQW